MIRKKKLFVRPKKLYIKSRISEENTLIQKYALKSKREIWKTLAKVNYFRSRAKALAKFGQEEQEVLFSKLQKMGLPANTISDVLALKVEELLERRLPSIVFKKGLAKTPKEARQMVSHKKILVAGKIINLPGYLISLDEENQITLRQTKQKKAPDAKSAEAQ